MKQNLHIFYILVCIMLCVGIILILGSQDSNSKSNASSNNSIVPIEETTKNVENYKYFSTLYKMQKTSDISFKYGNKYTYKIWEKTPASSIASNEENLQVLPSEYVATVYIDKIERINKTTCFHFSVEHQNKSITRILYKNGKEKIFNRVSDIGGSVYFVCQNGSIILPLFTEKKSDSPAYLLYSEWMLYLDKDVGWNEYVTMKLQDGDKEKDIQLRSENKVEGIEYINGRKCFKVRQNAETFAIHQISGKENILTPQLKTIYWVDVDKRITVKLEKYEENMLVLKMDLIKTEE